MSTRPKITRWDLAGQYHDAPIYELLGGSQQKLPCYASTYLGDDEPGGLSSPEAYADFAEQCLEMGYPAYKIHGWQSAPLKDQIAVVHAVGKRVGGKMDLMLDPFCAIKTFGDALQLGRAGDEYGFFWYEDPFRDGGISAHAHRKLRQLIKTPLLQLESAPLQRRLPRRHRRDRRTWLCGRAGRPWPWSGIRLGFYIGAPY